MCGSIVQTPHDVLCIFVQSDKLSISLCVSSIESAFNRVHIIVNRCDLPHHSSATLTCKSRAQSRGLPSLVPESLASYSTFIFAAPCCCYIRFVRSTQHFQIYDTSVYTQTYIIDFGDFTEVIMFIGCHVSTFVTHQRVVGTFPMGLRLTAPLTREK